MKDLLLVNLGSYSDFSVGEVYPIGLNKIKSFLTLRGYECVILDSHICPNLDMYKIFEMGFKYVGISIRNMDTLELDSRIQYEKYVNFINNLYDIKVNNNFESKIVIGGSGYSLYSEYINELIKYDYGIVGNGEYAFLNLLQGNNCEKNIEINECIQERIIYDVELVQAYLRAKPTISIGIQTYEGRCVKNCVYCCYNYKNTDFINKRKEDILAEIKQLKSLQVANIYIVDQVFNITDEYAIGILKYIKNELYDIKVMAFLNPSANQELYLLLHNCNVFAIYSFDSFSDVVLANLHKDFTVNEILKTIKLCRKYEVEFSCSLILGALGENEGTIRETCDFINKNIKKSCELCLGFGIRVLPKSRLFNLIEECNVNILEPTFIYFAPEIFDYFYHYVDVSKIPLETFLKHSHYKKSYYMRKFVYL